MRRNNSEKIFILLIGHGSRLPHNKEMVDMHADLLRKKGYNVCTAFNEMTDPPIEEAMRSMIRNGAEEIVALPLFIAPGRHTEQDIPPKLGIPEGYGCWISTKYGREVKVHYKEPFGDDLSIPKILVGKLKEIGCSDNTGVLIISHGSPMEHNSNLVHRTSERLRKSGVKNVFIGFNEYNEPRIEDAYAEMMEAGFDRIIVLPMFLASGTHIAEEIPEKLGIPGKSRVWIVRKGCKAVTVFYTGPLGLNPKMNDILVKKIESSVAS